MEISTWLLPGLVAGFLGWRYARFKLAARRIPEMTQRGGVIVDVRSPEEFAAGSNPASRNIPLGELERRVKELDPEKPVMVCCASGTRSAMAAAMLKARGFKQVVNLGPWRNTLPR
ncbi:MAG: rhodanese-like domain-containing protein [Elusimicrobiota bacterium]|jgi:rhodanese-related sulfurtransferase